MASLDHLKRLRASNGNWAYEFNDNAQRFTRCQTTVTEGMDRMTSGLGHFVHSKRPIIAIPRGKAKRAMQIPCRYMVV